MGQISHVKGSVASGDRPAPLLAPPSRTPPVLNVLLTELAAGLDRLGRQPPPDRPHPQQRAAVRVAGARRRHVALAGRYPDAAGDVRPRALMETETGHLHECETFRAGAQRELILTGADRGSFLPLVLDREGDVRLLGGRGPGQQPPRHMDSLRGPRGPLQVRWKEKPNIFT